MTAEPATPGTVLVTPRSFGRGSAPVTERLTSAGLRVTPGAVDHNLDELAPILTDAVGWIAGTAPIAAEHLRAAPCLTVIARYGAGVDNVELAAAARHGVTVTNTPDANTDAVAELTLGLLLSALRHVPAGDRAVRRAEWTTRRGRELGTMTLGLVGFGRIGRAVATRARCFGTTVLAHDPHIDADLVRSHQVEPVELADLATRCDAVSLHLPGGQQVIDAAWLATARPGMVMVNAARAELVDEAALATELRSGRIASYAADTLSGAKGEVASPLLAKDLTDQVLVTPHLGAQTVEAVDRMGTGAVQGVLEVLSGHTPTHPVCAPGGNA